MNRTVVCAAIKYDDIVYCGPRHMHIFNHMGNELMMDPVEYKPHCEQGFVDQHNVFMDREEARDVAIHAGQVTTLEIRANQLFSEDLY